MFHKIDQQYSIDNVFPGQRKIVTGSTRIYIQLDTSRHFLKREDGQEDKVGYHHEDHFEYHHEDRFGYHHVVFVLFQKDFYYCEDPATHGLEKFGEKHKPMGSSLTTPDKVIHLVVSVDIY